MYAENNIQWGTFDYLKQVSSLPPVQRIKQLTLEMLNLRSGDRVLDIGCGTGEDVRAMAQIIGAEGEAIGVDIRENQILEAKQRHGHWDRSIRFFVGDAYQLNFHDGYFDGSRADRLLQHLSHPELVIIEMARITRSGGMVVVHDVDWETLVVDVPKQKGTTRKILNLFCDNVANGWAGRTLTRLLRQSGLEEIQSIPFTGIIPHFSLANELFSLSEFAARAVDLNLITQIEKELWLTDLYQLDEGGNFFCSLTSFIVSGKKA